MTDATPDIDPTAAEALASIILERAADATSDTPALAAVAIENLAGDTGLSLDVCAGVMLAVSTVMGLGGVTAPDVYGAAMALDPTGRG